MPPKKQKKSKSKKSREGSRPQTSSQSEPEEDTVNPVAPSTQRTPSEERSFLSKVVHSFSSKKHNKVEPSKDSSGNSGPFDPGASKSAHQGRPMPKRSQSVNLDRSSEKSVQPKNKKGRLDKDHPQYKKVTGETHPYERLETDDEDSPIFGRATRPTRPTTTELESKKDHSEYQLPDLKSEKECIIDNEQRDSPDLPKIVIPPVPPKRSQSLEPYYYDLTQKSDSPSTSQSSLSEATTLEKKLSKQHISPQKDDRKGGKRRHKKEIKIRELSESPGHTASSNDSNDSEELTKLHRGRRPKRKR